MTQLIETALQPGQLLARGLCRHLLSHNFIGITEFVPTRGLRVDVIAIGPKGEIWIIECKSSRADFQSDSKWQGYLEWCDQYFWCVGADFPMELLPEDTGLIVGDAYDAEILRHGPATPLPAARRKSMMVKLARVGAARLHGFTDPRPGVKYQLD